ncbi:MAG: hypothetical protein WA691_03265 [Thermoplasmata archaeon]
MGHASARAPAPSGTWLGHPRLIVPEPVGFPYRQTATVAKGGIDRTSQLITQTLVGLGFEIIFSGPAPTAPGTDPSTTPAARTLIAAERNVRFDAPDLIVRLTIWTFVGAGIVLGVIDAAVYVSVVVLFPWVGAFTALALLFWFVYGRTYRSDVAMVYLAPVTSPGTGASVTSDAQPHAITVLAGAVRSDTRSAPKMGSRQPIRVEREFRMVRVPGLLIRAVSPKTTVASPAPKIASTSPGPAR